MSTAPLTIDDDEFQAFQHLIYTETGISLNDSKRCLLSSRLAKRLRALNFHDYLDYYDYLLRRDPDGHEMQEMINCITTNKTDFFREPHHFEFLLKRVFPSISCKASGGAPRRVRIWCAACSRGHEPYSIAMTVREHALFNPSWDIRILASDIDTQVLQSAEAGIYSMEELLPIGEQRLHRFFDRGTGRYAGKARTKSQLRDLITFRQINLIDPDWPIHVRFDVIFCRNAMIYFDAPTQRAVIEHLANHLVPTGYLMLGHSENIQWSPSPLRSLGRTIFQCIEGK